MIDTLRYHIAQNGRVNTISLKLRVILHIFGTDELVGESVLKKCVVFKIFKKEKLNTLQKCFCKQFEIFHRQMHTSFKNK